MPSAAFRRFATLSLIAVLWGGVVPVNAQDVTEGTLKGAFLFNFARFTEWPSDAVSASTAISVCVVANRAVGDALTRAASGQRLNGRPVVVSVLEPNVPLPACHLLYVSGVARARMTELVTGLRDTPVLTVGDDDGFMKAGGIIQFFIENGKVRFRINPGAARHARLQLSSRLLAVAEVVDEEPSQPAVPGPASHVR